MSLHYLKLFSPVPFVLLLIGCGNPYGQNSVIGVDHAPGLPSSRSLPISKGSEFVSAAQHNTLSINGTHRVSGTLGPLASKPFTRTDMNQKVFSNVQGQLLSNSGAEF